MSSNVSSSSMSSAQELLSHLSSMSQGFSLNRSKSRVTAEFIRGNSSPQNEWMSATDSACMHLLSRMLASNAADFLVGIVILCDCVLTSMEIDIRARADAVPIWLDACICACYVIYLVEFLARLCVKRWGVLRDGVLVFAVDFVILVSGTLEMIVGALQISVNRVNGVGTLRVLRVVRIMRTLRFLRRFRMLKELRRMVQMFATCFKTLCWSFAFCFIIMTIWAMFLVELVNPLVRELAEQGVWLDCDYCPRVFSSVMNANLTLFRTIVAGDGWGQHAMPVIEAHPWTALIFVGAHLTLVFGVMNLVVAVVVDTFAEQREKNVQDRAQEIDADEEEDQEVLRKMFEQIDRDRDGALSLEEVVNGAKQVPEFRSRLRVMDIDEQDLQQLFYMLDADGSEGVEPEEFIQALSRWLRESKTATRFVKYNMMRFIAQQADVMQKLEQLESQVVQPRNKLNEVASQLLQRQDTPYQKAEELLTSTGLGAGTVSSPEHCQGATHLPTLLPTCSSRKLTGMPPAQPPPAAQLSVDAESNKGGMTNIAGDGEPLGLASTEDLPRQDISQATADRSDWSTRSDLHRILV